MENEFTSRQLYPIRGDSVYAIEFFLPEDAIVTLTILSEHGKTVGRVLEQAKLGSGRHEIEFIIAQTNGNSCFYRLAMRTDRQEVVDTKKIFM